MPPTATADVNDLIDRGRWTVYQRWLVVLTAITIVFDGIDNQLLGIAIPHIMRAWSVTRGAFAPVVALGFLGMASAVPRRGLAGDRIGRRTALLGSMVIFGLATLAVSTAETIASLAVLRMLAGFGLGGAMPNAAALAAEYVPLRQRPIAVTVTIVCVPLGGTLAGLVGDSIAAVARLAGAVRPRRRCPGRGGNRAAMAAAGITSVSGPPPFEMDRARTDAAADGPSRSRLALRFSNRAAHSIGRRSARFFSGTSARTRSRCGPPSSRVCLPSISDSAGCRQSSRARSSARQQPAPVSQCSTWAGSSARSPAAC